MKKLFLVFFTLFICFMKSQDIVSIIKNNPSKRTDLKIKFNEENPHHYIPISVINGRKKDLYSPSWQESTDTNILL